VRFMSINRRILLVFLALSIFYTSALAENYSINVSADKFLGTLLVNQSGYTLYYFSDDASGNGASTCTGECAAKWPPFYAGVITVPDSLKAVDFATITRADGLNQTTYKGWPLYLYSGDKEAGFTSGNGRDDNRWHIVNPQDQPVML